MCRGDPAGRPRQAGAAGQHRPGIQCRPGLRPHDRQHHHRHRCGGGAVGVGDQPRPGRRGLPRTHHRSGPRPVARTGTARDHRATLRVLHHRDRLVQRIHRIAHRFGRPDEAVRPRTVRHRADRAHHPAVATPRLVDRLPRRRQGRRVVPGSAVRTGEAAGTVRGRGGGPGRSAAHPPGPGGPRAAVHPGRDHPHPP